LGVRQFQLAVRSRAAICLFQPISAIGQTNRLL
jgi:hypothetical protein